MNYVSIKLPKVIINILQRKQKQRNDRYKTNSVALPVKKKNTVSEIKKYTGHCRRSVNLKAQQ